METFDWIILLLLSAALLSALARRLGVPYPAFLAIGGACLAFIPHVPQWTLDPHLALTLFVAPVLLNAAHDTSQRDLRDNWAPVAGLVLIAVGTTTAAVACATRWLVPDMPWAAAIALGAIVAPPDAASITAVMREVRLPHRLIKILEGESLLNDATALLISRLAIVATVSGSFTPMSVAPLFALTVAGSLLAGVACGWLVAKLNRRIDDVPTALIAQFGMCFGIWAAAEAIGLSAILTIVAFAMTIARGGGVRVPARKRVPIYAFWETADFVLNAFAFILIGMQLRPIFERLGPLGWEYAMIGAVALATVIVTRFAWVMTYNTAVRLKIARYGFHPPRPMAKPTVRSGILISWAGMRGIVTLAAAFSIPETVQGGSPFPYRDLIILTAFCVVFGTLVIQGLTLAPLIRRLKLADEDPVAKELLWARAEISRAALAAIEHESTAQAEMLRNEYREAIRWYDGGSGDNRSRGLPGSAIRRRAIAASYAALDELRRSGAIGDDAFYVLQEELDWAKLSTGAAES